MAKYSCEYKEKLVIEYMEGHIGYNRAGKRMFF